MLSAFLWVGIAHAIEVHGHRGARGSFPENTIPAFEFALEAGVDYLELDVHMTRDDQLVISHDPYVNPEHCLAPDGARMTGKPGLRGLTLAEIQAYDCGSLPNPKFPRQQLVPGTRMPSLEQLLDWLDHSTQERARKVGLHIEIKAFPKSATAPAPLIADALARQLAAHGMLDRVIIQSFNFPYAKLANATLVASGGGPRRKVISPPVGWILGWKGHLLFKLLRRMHNDVIPWTANTPREWDELIRMGVPGIITDYPAELIRYLKDHP